MFTVCAFLLITFVYSFTPQQYGENRKPYYFNNPTKSIKPIESNNNLDYEIPKWVYNKVFKHNKPTKKIKENDYFHALNNYIPIKNTDQ